MAGCEKLCKGRLYNVAIDLMEETYADITLQEIKFWWRYSINTMILCKVVVEGKSTTWRNAK